MKNFNFFNLMRGESGKFANTPPYGFNHASRCGNIIAMSALTVGSPSVHRRWSKVKHVAFMLLFLMGSLNVWGDTTKSSTSFSTLSGNIGNDANISYSTGNGSATTATAIDGTSIKLYRSTGDNAGGILLLTANNGVKIKSFKITFTGTLGYRSASNTTAAAKTNYTSLTSGTAVTNLNLSSVQIGNIATGKTQAFISAIEVTYSSGASYTITAQSNNTTYGTVSLSGTTITGSPKSGYRYATPAYTVTSGTATVSQNGNAFTVTPSSDCTVQINFEPIPTHTVTYVAQTGTAPEAVQVAEGSNVTLPNTITMPAGCTEWELVGWYSGNDELALDNKTLPTSNYAAKGTSVQINSDVTYKAVYKKTVQEEAESTASTTKDISSNIASGDWATTLSSTSALTWGTGFAASTNNATLSIATPSNATITQIALIGGNQWAGNTKTAITAQISGTQVGTFDVSTKTVSVATNKQVKGGGLVLTHTPGTNGAWFNKITITYSYPTVVPTDVNYYSTSTDCCLAWSDPTISYSSYALTTSETATLTVSGATHGTISYESSNSSVITVDENNGKVTAVGGGTAYVIIRWTAADGYCEKEMHSEDFIVTGNVSVAFHANGGTGEMANQSIQVNTATALSANTFTAPSTCQYFYGWATSEANADAKTRAYENEEVVTITEGMELWAIWKTYNYAVTKGTNTGAATFSLSAENVDCGGTITVTATPDASHKGEPKVTISPADKGEVSSTTINNITANITVNVSFDEKENFEVTWSVNGAETKKSFLEGTTFEAIMADASKPVVEDDAVSNCANKFMGWATAPISIENATASDVTWYNGETALSGATTFYAVWATGSGAGENDFVLVEEELSDWSGTYLLVNYSGNDHAMSSTLNSGKFGAVAVTPSNKTITCTNDKLIWIFAKGTGENASKYSIKNKDTNTYASIGSGSTSASLGTASYLAIEFDANNQAKVKGASGRWFSYNTSNTDFRTYSGDYNGVYLYKKGETVDYITSCCALQPATDIQVSAKSANSVTLTWTDPSPAAGIDYLKVVDAYDVVKADNIALGTKSATISGLSQCNEYSYRVVSVGACEVYSESIDAVPFGGAKTVTFQYKDGETADLVVETSCGSQSVNLPDTPSREGYQFLGWFNGENEVTSAITPEADMIIEAHWAQLFTVTYDLNGGTLSPAPVGGSYIAGASVEFNPGNPSKVFSEFNEWTFSPTVTMIDATHFEMPGENVTITATYTGKEGTWMLVTDATTLAANDTVVIAYNGSNKVAGDISNNIMASVTASFSTDKSIMNNAPSDAVIFKLGGNATDGWTFNEIQTEKKLGSTSQGKMAWDNGTQTWSISISTDGKATINASQAIGNLQYNTNSPRFTTYTTSQGLPQLYRFREGTFFAINLPANVEGGTIYANPVMAKSGQSVTLTYTPSTGYGVKTLTVAGESGNVAISPALADGVTEYTFTMPAEDVTVAAEFELLPAVAYTLVENADNLAVGMEFLLVGSNAGGTKYYASGAVNSSGSGDYLAGAAILAPAEKQISITTQAIANITLEGESGKWELMVGDDQLFANDEWTIAISGGAATIAEVGATSNVIQFNTNGTRFKDYTSNQQPIAIYALPYTTFNFTMDGYKTIKVADGYSYTYTFKNTDVPSEAPAGCTFYGWTDGTNYYQAGDQITVNADITLTATWTETLRENVSSGRYGTICWPKAGKLLNGTLYEVAYYETASQKIFFDEVINGEMVAGRPYIFLPNEDVTTLQAATRGAAVSEPNNTDTHGLYGSFVTIEGLTPNDGNYILKNNMYYLVNTGYVNCVANRAYIKMAEVPGYNNSNYVPNTPAPGRRRISMSVQQTETATGFENVQGDEVQTSKVLINGEIFILRGEKMYDVTGKLVK